MQEGKRNTDNRAHSALRLCAAMDSKGRTGRASFEVGAPIRMTLGAAMSLLLIAIADKPTVGVRASDLLAQNRASQRPDEKDHRNADQHNEYFERNTQAPVVTEAKPARSEDQRIVLVSDGRQECA